MDCNLCPLRQSSGGPVWGDGDPSSPYWLVGEAPGEQEDRERRPFVGKSGVELNDNYLLRNGLERSLFYVTNLVKCRPPKNRDPRPEEIAVCRQHLDREMQEYRPAVIGTLGRFASTEILGRKVDMTMYHGVPLHLGNGSTVVPIYHPALGLHSTSMMIHITNDFQALSAVIRGSLKPEDYIDPIPNTNYEEYPAPPSTFDFRVMGVDTESVDGKIWSIQFSVKAGESIFIPAGRSDGVSWLRDKVKNPDILVVLHNAQHDLPMLAQVGIIPARWTDTMLMANLLGDLPKGLKALAFRLAHMTMHSYSEMVDPITTERAIQYLARVMQFKWPKPPKIQTIDEGEYRWKQPWSAHTMAKSILNSVAAGTCDDPYKRWHEYPSRGLIEGVVGKLVAATIADVDPKTAIYYACRDADATLRVYHHLNPRIQAANQLSVLDRDCRVVPMVADMERCGMAVDQPHFMQLGDEYEKRKWGVVEKIEALVGYKVNPGSSDQVADLLFKRLGLKPKWRTKDGADSTNAAVLEVLEGSHPVVPLIMEYRELDKMRGTFVEGVLDNCQRWADGRCRTHLLMIRASTGRFAAKGPNLLAFPQEDRSTEGKALRDGFVAGPGRVFVSGDYSQIELRVLAHVSQEPTMIEVFRSGGDIHQEMAAQIYKIPADLVNSEQRNAVKKVNFGIPYGITEAGLYKFLGPQGWSKKACERLINDWFSRFSAVAGFMDRTRIFARRHRYVEDMFGRRRLIPEVLSAHQFVREAGLRQAGNQPIQTGANSILKEAMAQLVPIYKQLQREGHYIWPLLPIHDDLLWEMDRSIVTWAIPLIKSIMEGCLDTIGMPFSVPIVVDFKVGERWGSMEKWK